MAAWVYRPHRLPVLAMGLTPTDPSLPSNETTPQAARELLTLDEKDPRRVFEGPALLRRCVRAGLLEADKAELDYVLQLTTQKLLERRLQTKVYKQSLAKSIHHARVLIRQRHIRYVR